MTKNTTPDYQSLSDELAEIVAMLQSGELSIDAALPAYERGTAIIKELEQLLTTAENRVIELQAALQE